MYIHLVGTTSEMDILDTISSFRYRVPILKQAFEDVLEEKGKKHDMNSLSSLERWLNGDLSGSTDIFLPLCW